MSATNLDLPVLISPEQIRRREFVTIRRGYDPDQVRAYLEQIADQVERMRAMQLEAQAEAEAAIRANAQPLTDPYEQLGQRVASVIKEADRAAETIRSEARLDAETWAREARADADRVRTDAQARAEEARARAEAAVRMAREEADRTLAGLATRRDALVDQLASMQERLTGVARELESAMEVKVALPDIEAIDDLLGGSDEERPRIYGDDLGSPTETAPPPTPVWQGDAATDVPDADRMIVVDESREPDGPPQNVDPAYEELWEGTEAVEMSVPEIPSLDLDWGYLDEGDLPAEDSDAGA